MCQSLPFSFRGSVAISSSLGTQSALSIQALVSGVYIVTTLRHVNKARAHTPCPNAPQSVLRMYICLFLVFGHRTRVQHPVPPAPRAQGCAQKRAHTCVSMQPRVAGAGPHG